MRELTTTEITEISGGDGFKLPGGGYISTTGRILTGLGIVGAVSTAYTVGYAIGTGVNYALESQDVSVGGAIYNLRNGS